MIIGTEPPETNYFPIIGIVIAVIIGIVLIFVFILKPAKSRDTDFNSDLDTVNDDEEEF